MVLGDTHFPWTSNKALEHIYGVAKEIKPAVVIQVGDLYDMYSFSRYPVDPNTTSPEREVERGFRGAEKMWSTFRRVAPQARLVQLLGNHDDRASKRMNETLPAVKCLADRGLRGLFTFEGVETIHDPTEEFFLGSVVYMHGHRSKLGDHARHNQMSTVCGHSHHGGVVWHRNRRGPYFELNAGWLGDEKAPVFRYGAQKTLRGWTTGFGIVDERGPRFVCLGGR